MILTDKSFDYMITSDGKAYLIECNPRPTSGIHLLKQTPNFKKDCETFSMEEKQELYSLRSGIKNGFSRSK